MGMIRVPLRRIGKRGREWQAVWRRVKPELEHAGVTRCEFGFEGCTHGLFLTPAHSLKRRNCVTEELLAEVAIACQSCHEKLELMLESEMAKHVLAAIAARS